MFFFPNALVSMRGNSYLYRCLQVEQGNSYVITLTCLINVPPRLLEISKKILKIGRILVKKINFLKSKKALTKTECSKSMN